jgi:Tol biopolymer transport system component
MAGKPAVIADGVQGGFSVSDNGLLLYRKGFAGPVPRQLTWFDRTGKQLGRLGETGNYGDLNISPSGDRVAYDTTINGNRDIWVIDVARAIPSRVTFDPSSDWNPQWSPDGSRIAFASGKGDTPAHIYEKPSTGVGTDQLVFQDQSEIPVDWSRDGRYMVFSRLRGGNQGNNTWVLDLSGQKKASPFNESPFDKAHARISPDGRWLAYTSNDSGMYQIVVQTFPDPNGGKWQITAQGGAEPKSRRDGRELYYLAFDGKLMAVPIKPGPTFEAGTPMALFETSLTVNRAQPERTGRYDVAPDGRFLISVPQGTATTAPVIAIVNWTSGM